MTSAEQNALIAEAMGWKKASSRCRLTKPEAIFHRVYFCESDVHDYLHSDSAARELRESLDEEEQGLFEIGLKQILAASDLLARSWFSINGFDFLNATPRQQAEAYCRVKGIKWEVEG